MKKIYFTALENVPNTVSCFVKSAMVLLLLMIATSSVAQCPTPPGDPTVYGTDSWIGYVYSGLDTNNPPQNAFTTTVYRGYVTQPEQFNYNLDNAAPTAATVCGSYPDSFSIRYRMRKNFPAGNYYITLGGDDGVRLSVDGGATWVISDWNYHSYQTTSATVYLDGSKDLVIESYDQGGQYRVSFNYSACLGFSTAPTGISGTSAICNGTSTTLTATGGVHGGSSTYQWGTGNTVGNNIIAGQTGASITVSPNTTTTYWVRRQDPAPCSVNTTGVTQEVTVTPVSSAPTGISGTTTICAGASTTLTATGGTLGAGSTYEWGTGTVGSNVISGQTGVSITITPAAGTYNYWVRRVNPGTCGTTNAATTTVNVGAVSGDQVSYGNGAWIGYVYTSIDGANPPANPFGTTYRGYVTQNEQFNYDLGGNAMTAGTMCGSYDTNYAIRFKMTKNWTAGYYTFTVGGDDGYRFSMDGGASWTLTNWNDHSYATSTTAQIYLSGSKDFVIEYYERGGDSRVSFSYVACTDFSSAPTGISGTTAICNGTSTTLTATGGYAGAYATYQWGTGTTVGNNTINGQTGVSITVSPTNTTTYWVRRVDGTPCNLTTTGVTQQVTVTNPSTAPTGISGTTTTCGGSTTLTATGGTLATGSAYEWGTGTVGQNIISGATGVSITVTPASTTTYWVRRTGPAPCNNGTNAFSVTVTVNQASTAPTSVTGNNSQCSIGTTGVTLTANGGTAANGSTYQWGTGTNIGANIIGGQSGQTMFVQPTATTTYWVRRYDSSCNAYTGGVTVTIYRGSTGPYSISGNGTVCANQATTLTAQNGTLATGSSYQWGTGNIGGVNVISGATGASISVTPTAQTTYWVRIVDTGTCPGTDAVFYTLNTYTPATPVTSVSGPTTLCPNGGGGNLVANGMTLGSNATLQWGTGTVGQNIFATSNNVYINPTATTTYWVRTYDATCNVYTTAQTYTVTVNVRSTDPTGISGTTTICNGGSTTLTATGGTVGTGATYAWGTGYTVGQNVIAGQTGVSITVSPPVNTVYWVRRIDPAPCSTQTQGPTVFVSVITASTAPTSIMGGPSSSVCAGSTYTLYANGGSPASGSTYQWGTGTVGSNVIAGQTGMSITVTPTATTTYWVRRYDGSPCSAYTAAATTTINITTPPGTPSSFGTNQWNAYGYATGDITLASAVYAGYYVQSTLDFSTQTGTNSWNNQNSPSYSAGWNGCPVPVDNFTLVYKRMGFPCGTYTISLPNWDDQAQVYINGTLVWSCNSYSGGGACSGNIPGSFNLSTNSTIEVRLREQGGGANIAMSFTKTDVASTAPTSVSGGTTVCDGASVTLTAIGGTTGTNGSFQWGTGAAGSNVISGATSASITFNPTATTTYWVRRIDTLCGSTTVAATTTVTVSGGTVAGSLTASSSAICRGSAAGNITLSGQTGNVIKWQYASNSAFTTGVTDIAYTGTTLTSAQIGSLTATRYFRAVVQNGGCTVAYTAPVAIEISATVYYNGTWSGTPTALTPVVVSANLNVASNLNVCACQVTNGATVTVQSTATLIVQREIIVEESAHLTVESSGSIVQVEDDAVNMGAFTIKRNSAPMKNYDFTYWSSPVQGITLHDLSPLTRYDKYYSFNPITNQWVIHTNGNAVMEPGRGYTVRAPLDWSVTNETQGVYNAVFSGIANTGIVPVTIQKGSSKYNLIGNPYPSAIDIDKFITDPANAGLVNGTIYLWTHNTAVSSLTPGNAQYNYAADDYAKYNLTGGVKTASSAITGGVEPTGKVASGQGFFIQAHTTLANGTYSATFRNAMRVVNQNGQFFKNAANTETATEDSPTGGLEKHRAWLNITNTTGAYDEMLLGYIESATNGIDPWFDGQVFNGGNYVSLYSLVGTTKLAIQGRALPFNVNDVIPLGYKTSIAGTLSIALEHFDGLFANQNVYLLDKSDMSYHNLSEGAYSFTSATGIFESRFELHFQTSQLGVGDHTPNENSVYIVKQDKHIEISSGNYSMTGVEIFDLTGKKVYEKDAINATLFSTRDLNIAAQVVIVKVKLENDVIVTKKIVMY